MGSLQMSKGRLARLALELALASFTMWLIAQNAVLLALSPWKQTPAPFVVAGAVLKVVWIVIVRAWPWMLGAAIVAGVLVAALAHAPAPREVRHV